MKNLDDLDDFEIQKSLDLLKKYNPEHVKQERSIVEAQIQGENMREEFLKNISAESSKALRAELEANERPLKIMQGIEEAVYKHKDSTDKAIGIHEEQLEALKMSNKFLKSQVSKLGKTIGFLKKQLKESEKQTFELIDTNELLKKQINDAEEQLRKQKVANIIQDKINKKNQRRMNIQFIFMILSFCISLITAITNPNVQKFVLSFF